jgi:hypothetical protein
MAEQDEINVEDETPKKGLIERFNDGIDRLVRIVVITTVVVGGFLMLAGISGTTADTNSRVRGVEANVQYLTDTEQASWW